MSEKSWETLPVALSTIEALEQRIGDYKKIKNDIVQNSYDTKNVTNAIIVEYEQEFNITERRLADLCLELARRQTYDINKENI